MAWSATGTGAFLDAFQHYTLSTAVTQGKWTSGTVPTAVTIAEDGRQGARGGALTKVLATGAAGHIICTRGASGTTSGQECIFKIAGTLAQEIRLIYDKDINRIILVTPDAVSHTSTQLSMQNGIAYTFEFAYLYTGAAFNYALYVTDFDDVTTQILDVGSTIATASVPSMTDLSIAHSTVNGLDQRSFIAVKAYSGSGPSFAAGDLYGNVSRGVKYPNADGRWPATTPSRSWIPSTGSSYFGVLDETLASTSDYISEFTDVGGTPGGSPNYLDRASWSFTASPSDVLAVPHVQFNNLVQMLNGTGTYSLYMKTNIADDVTTTIGTPITAPASWGWRCDSYGTDPRNGSIPWTKTLIDSLEVAIEPVNFT